jgi:hypothetical protein
MMGKAVSLYLDDETYAIAQARAKEAELSLSRYVSDVLKTAAQRAWSKGLVDALGSIADVTFVEPGELSYADDAARELW